jgi:hypothetical protein
MLHLCSTIKRGYINVTPLFKTTTDKLQMLGKLVETGNEKTGFLIYATIPAVISIKHVQLQTFSFLAIN